MKVEHFTETPAETQEAPGVTIRWLIGKDDGAPSFAMRVIEVEPGCNTPFHTHDFEHEVYILAGAGVVRGASGEMLVEPGTAVYVEPGEKHGFFNTGDEALRFICVIPHQG